MTEDMLKLLNWFELNSVEWFAYWMIAISRVIIEIRREEGVA